jgi:hypothetical protein
MLVYCYVPESATMSFWESPCAAKREVRLERPDVGGGMLLLAPLKLAVVESLLPTFTSQFGPPSCTHTQHARTYVTTLHSFQVRHLPLATYSVIQHCVLLTMTTLSLAAMATMSAHDTTPGHTFSTADLMASMTSNPLAEPLLGVAVFSPWKLGVSSSSNDASHPCVTYDDC